MAAGTLRPADPLRTASARQEVRLLEQALEELTPASALW